MEINFLASDLVLKLFDIISSSFILLVLSVSVDRSGLANAMSATSAVVKVPFHLLTSISASSL